MNGPLPVTQVPRLCGSPLPLLTASNVGLTHPALRDKSEIASLSGASDDARYFQISVPVQPGMLESKL